MHVAPVVSLDRLDDCSLIGSPYPSAVTAQQFHASVTLHWLKWHLRFIRWFRGRRKRRFIFYTISSDCYTALSEVTLVNSTLVLWKKLWFIFYPIASCISFLYQAVQNLRQNVCANKNSIEISWHWYANFLTTLHQKETGVQTFMAMFSKRLLRRHNTRLSFCNEIYWHLSYPDTWISQI